MEGKIHIYFGDGKGKTTAATGLCIRAKGAEKKVLFVQFLKDGSSSEVGVLKTLSHVKVLTVKENFGFTYCMDAETRDRAKKAYGALLVKAFNEAKDVDVLVLDEVISAVCASLISEEALLTFLQNKPDGTEIVLTGNTPSEALLKHGDYITEMKKNRPPFDTGTAARRGIEF